MGPKRTADGVLELTLPMGDKRLPGVAAEEIRKSAYGILKKGAEYIGRTVGIAGGPLTGAEMDAEFSRALGGGGPPQRRGPRGLPRLRLPRR
jgi:hypothetical protein